MNESKTRGISIEVSAGDFIDRYVISLIRRQKLSIADETSWLAEQMDEASSLTRSLGVQASLVGRLQEIHLVLWDLENYIRSVKDDTAFCRAARRIFALNDERHNVKAEIDRTLPTRCASIRFYSDTTI